MGGPRAQVEDGRAAAFSALFDANHRRIRSFARRRVEEGRVDDVVSETFLAAWRRFDELPPGTDAAVGWLFRTADLVVMNLSRSQRRHVRLGERVAFAGGDRHDPASATDDDTGALVEAFGSLPGDDRSILLLAAWDGLTNEELGATLGCLAGAAATRLSRARSRFGAAAAARGVDVG